MNSNATAIFWRAAGIGSAAGSSHGPVERPDAEHVAAVPGERVPEADADPEVVLHPLAEDDAVRLVDLERERIGRVEAAERDRARHLREEVVAHVRPSVRAHAHRILYRE